jgi:hypothetical protein
MVKLFRLWAGRTYVHTEEGYLGLAPPDARPGTYVSSVGGFLYFTDQIQGDIICVLLGCDNPMLLREQEDESFTVVGECFVHGLNDAIGLLGSMPTPRVTTQRVGHGGRMHYTFVNLQTGIKTDDDPRLEPTLEWERLAHKTEQDDPECFDYFLEKETGEIFDSDPRLSLENLIDRVPKRRVFSLN